MAIYLLPEETKYLKDLLEKQPKWWVKDKLIEKIEDDQFRRGEMAVCNHSKAEYVGEKTCCSKCGSFYEPGMKVTWQLQNGRLQRELP